MNIRSSSMVVLHMPGTQYPPAQMTLAMVRAGLLQGVIPPTAVVQVVPGGDWLPAQYVVAECLDLQPTRASGVMALIGLAPLALVIGHVTLFGSAGVLGPVVLLVAGVIGLAVMGNTSSLRTRSSSVLLRSRAFQLTAGAVLLACEVPAIAFGVIDRHEHTQIDAALSSANPCDVEGVSQLVDKDGTDEEKSRAESRKSDCEAARYKQGCDQLVAHLDGNALTPDDLAWLKTHGEPKDSDVVSRLATHALTDSSDPSLTETDLGCTGRIWDRVVKALATTPAVWTENVQPSTAMVTALGTVGLSPESQAALLATAEAAAPSFAKKNKSEDMKPGVATCELCSTLHVAMGPACTALEARYTRIVTREATIASAKDGQQQAIDDAARKRDSAGFVSCVARCNRARSTADREAESACLEACGGDVSCGSKCHQASACDLSCVQQYPDAVNGY